jgi:hypothetical protein
MNLLRLTSANGKNHRVRADEVDDIETGSRVLRWILWFAASLEFSVNDGVTNVARAEIASNIKPGIERKNHEHWVERNRFTLKVASNNSFRCAKRQRHQSAPKSTGAGSSAIGSL